MRQQVTIDQLVTDPAAQLELTIRAGRENMDRAIFVPRIQKPGLAMAGYREQLHENRVLVLGGTEVEFMACVTEAERGMAVETMLASDPACFIITRGLEPPTPLRVACEDNEIPLMVSTLVSSELITRITKYLGQQLSPRTSVHGVLLDVLGIGILLLGKSGIGKSEAALDLIVRGHRLVADDIVDIQQQGNDYVYGSGSSIIKHHMEIRGLGIINIKDLFGISAVRELKKIELVIELSLWEEHKEYDRLGLDEEIYEVLDVRIPMLRVPVRPGRNVATLIEVAARNQLLKLQGHNSAQVFQEELNRAIAEARPRNFDMDPIE